MPIMRKMNLINVHFWTYLFRVLIGSFLVKETRSLTCDIICILNREFLNRDSQVYI